jgi:lysophospholipase L1-like esterase
MFWYEDEVHQLEKKVRSTAEVTNRTVFYGSSSIRLWKTLAHDFPEKQVLNIGFGGSTLAACSWFFERLLVPAQPRAVVFYAGDNDLSDGRHPEEVYLFFCALTSKMQHHMPEVPFTFVAIKPSPARWHIIDRIRFANELIRKKIESMPGYHFVDVYTPMLEAGGRPRWELFENDGLHLSPKGYALWQEILLMNSDVF